MENSAQRVYVISYDLIKKEDVVEFLLKTGRVGRMASYTDSTIHFECDDVNYKSWFDSFLKQFPKARISINLIAKRTVPNEQYFNHTRHAHLEQAFNDMVEEIRKNV